MSADEPAPRDERGASSGPLGWPRSCSRCRQRAAAARRHRLPRWCLRFPTRGAGTAVGPGHHFTRAGLCSGHRFAGANRCSGDQPGALLGTADRLARAAEHELVGNWEVNSGTDSTGSQQIWRFYEFTATASMTTSWACAGPRPGLAPTPITRRATPKPRNGRLTLTPQTGSQQGPQTWPYVVDRDPVVGDVRLVLTLPDGQMDIFYRP